MTQNKLAIGEECDVGRNPHKSAVEARALFNLRGKGEEVELIEVTLSLERSLGSGILQATGMLDTVELREIEIE